MVQSAKRARQQKSLHARKGRQKVANMDAGRASKRQEMQQLTKDNKELLLLAQSIHAGMTKGRGVPLAPAGCMVVGLGLAGIIAHAAVPVSCICGTFFGTGCPQVLLSTIPIATTHISPYFCV